MKKVQLLYCLSFTLALCTVHFVCSANYSIKAKAYETDIEQLAEVEIDDQSNLDGNGPYNSLLNQNDSVFSPVGFYSNFLHPNNQHFTTATSKLYLVYGQLKLHS